MPAVIAKWTLPPRIKAGTPRWLPELRQERQKGLRNRRLGKIINRKGEFDSAPVFRTGLIAPGTIFCSRMSAKTINGPARIMSALRLRSMTT
jgi:hypothetical protein